MARPPMGTTTLDRFLAKVKFTDSTTCWLWTGNLMKDGYAGTFRVNGKMTYSYRWSCEYFNEVTIPPGHHVDHLCKNIKCVNPDHLEIVSPQENMNRSSVGRKLTYGHPTCRNGHLLITLDDYYIDNGYKRCRECTLNNRQKAYQLQKLGQQKGVSHGS